MYLGRFVNHGSRRRASLIYFIKYLTYLHLGQIDQAFIWLLYRYRFFSSFLNSVRYNQVQSMELSDYFVVSFNTSIA